MRIYRKTTDMAIADLIMREGETIDETKPLVIFDPVDTWKKMSISNFYTKELLKPIFVDGKQVYQSPALLDIQKKASKELSHFWEEYKRIEKPHIYKVDLSQKLYDLKTSMLNNR